MADSSKLAWTASCGKLVTATDGLIVHGRTALWIAVAASGHAWTIAGGTIGQVETDHGSAEDLTALCPAPLDSISDGCWDALQDRYAPEAVVTSLHWYPGGEPQGWWSPTPADEGISWKDLFADPMALRARVDVAMERSDCLVPESAVRPDLRVPCDAAALAALGLLLEACLPLRDDPSREPRDWRKEWALEHEVVSTDRRLVDRGGALAELSAKERHFAWRLRRCASVPPTVFDPVERLPKPSSFWRIDVGQAHDLRHAAARLGDIWASARTVGSEEDINSAAAADLVVGYIRRAGLSYIRNPSPHSDHHLPNLLAARTLDLRREHPVFDWGGLAGAFTADEIQAAKPVAERIVARGWQPLRKRRTPRSPREQRRWIGADGVERVQYGNSPPVIVTGDGFLSRCGQEGRELGYLPLLSDRVDRGGGAHRSEEMRELPGRATDAPTRRWVGQDGRDCVLAVDGTVVPVPD